ncbi:MAG: hypothetical protein HKN33_15845 [Pyrinomonadaceae bacterium]|nr:hypothetical protein [Pyrinomonadaceae bacterium]
MKEQQRQILRMVALLDIVIAIGLLVGIVLAGLAIPIIVPALMALSGLMILVISLVIK